MAGVGLLYFLGAGPAACFRGVSTTGDKVIGALYDSFEASVFGTPLGNVLYSYEERWVELAGPRPVFRFRFNEDGSFGVGVEP